MIVVLDTNIWVKELALSSSLGSALRFFLKRRSGRLAIPEVVRLEVKHHLHIRIAKAIHDVRDGHRALVALFGAQNDVVLPKSHEIEAVVDAVFTRLGVDTFDVPFSIESARASFLKTIEKAPPSDHSQEFKDGVLWADCLGLLNDDDVVLATQDKAFFADRKYDQGLAPNLVQEARALSHRLTVVPSIADVLEQIGTGLEIDDRSLSSVILDCVKVNVRELLQRVGVDVDGEPTLNKELFATERPEVLYFTYLIEIPCSDATGEGRTSVALILRGNGTLDPDTPAVLELRPAEETVTYVNADGTEGRTGNQYAYALGISGRAVVSHSVRHALDDAR